MSIEISMILKKKSSIHTFGLALLGLVPSAVFAEPIVQEKTAFQYSDSLKNRCLGKNNKLEKCLSQQENYIPETKVDEYIINLSLIHISEPTRPY